MCKKNPFGLANNNVARIIVIFLFCDAHNSRIIVGAGAPLGESTRKQAHGWFQKAATLSCLASINPSRMIATTGPVSFNIGFLWFFAEEVKLAEPVKLAAPRVPTCPLPELTELTELPCNPLLAQLLLPAQATVDVFCLWFCIHA